MFPLGSGIAFVAGILVAIGTGPAAADGVVSAATMPPPSLDLSQTCVLDHNPRNCVTSRGFLANSAPCHSFDSGCCKDSCSRRNVVLSWYCYGQFSRRVFEGEDWRCAWLGWEQDFLGEGEQTVCEDGMLLARAWSLSLLSVPSEQHLTPFRPTSPIPCLDAHPTDEFFRPSESSLHHTTGGRMVH